MNLKEITIFLLACTLLFSGCGGNNEQNVGPRTVKVKTLTAEAVQSASGQGYSGTIEEVSGSSLSFSSLGTVRNIYVSQGQMVAQGQLIATLDQTSVQSAYDAAVAAKEQALDAQQRLGQLHDSGSLPEIKWVEVQTQVRQAISAENIARKALADTRLCAPFSGYVSEKQAEAGQSVAPGVPIVKLVRIDRVKVVISVPEEEIARIKMGQVLNVEVPALGGKRFEATVAEKGVTADALSRSYGVKGVIANPHRELLPGMIATVSIRDGLSDNGSVSGNVPQAMVLPAEIIQIDADNRPFVWVVEEGRAQKVYLQLGANIGDAVQVLGGLEPGVKVICEGQHKVSRGMKVSE